MNTMIHCNPRSSHVKNVYPARQSTLKKSKGHHSPSWIYIKKVYSTYIKKVKGGTHPLRDLYEKVLSLYIEKVKGSTLLILD